MKHELKLGLAAVILTIGIALLLQGDKSIWVAGYFGAALYWLGMAFEI